jgi:hypothetical protein
MPAPDLFTTGSAAATAAADCCLSRALKAGALFAESPEGQWL